MLVDPHGGRDLAPLLLTGAELEAERRRAAEPAAAHGELARERRHRDARHRRLHAAVRLHDACRLAGRVRRHEDRPAGCSGRSRSRSRPTWRSPSRSAPGRRSRSSTPTTGSRWRRCSSPRCTRSTRRTSARRCSARPIPRTRAWRWCWRSRRSTSPDRSRCCRPAASPSSTATCSRRRARRARCSTRSAGRPSPRSRRATRCTARTSTWRRSPSRSATGCSCTRCSARSSPATFRRPCARVRSPRWPSATS